MSSLFESYRLGRMVLPNRVVMAPMTRSRAIGTVPNDLMREYYAQRASAGLVVTEGVAPSPDAQGYARIPGLYTPEQVAGWRAVTGAVHAAGGRIVAQLMHTGRIGHPANLPAGGRIVAPSAVKAAGDMWTDASGMQPMPAPEAMSAADVAAAKAGFVTSAKNAIEAGFDGIELHGANGYLLEQFLHPHANRREDAYGGSMEARNRFVLEVADEAGQAIGRDRVGIRLSPFNTFNDLPARDEAEVREQYVALARGLRGLLYVHLAAKPADGWNRVAAAVREAFGGPIIANGGYDRARAEADVAEGRADLVSFARPFISNPDLVARMKSGASLAEPDASTFYTPGAKGYTDYPTA